MPDASKGDDRRIVILKSERNTVFNPPYILLCCLISAGLMVPAKADNAKVLGKFAFRTDANLSKTSCTRITAQTASKIASASYRCESTPLSSGKKALMCSAPGGRGGYLIFDTMLSCESERKDEAVAE